jgi:predicted PurR-regulated permease PerM
MMSKPDEKSEIITEQDSRENIPEDTVGFTGYYDKTEKLYIGDSDPEEVPPADFHEQQNVTIDRLNRRLIIGTIIALGVILFWMFRRFLVPIVLAATFATLFHPMFKWFERLFKGNRAVGSFLSCAVLILGLLVPSYIIGRMVVSQTVSFYDSASGKIRLIENKLSTRMAGRFGSDASGILHFGGFSLDRLLDEGIRTANSMGTALVDRTSRSLAKIIITVLIMFFTLFYFFIDGERMIARLRYLSPLRNEYEDMIIDRFLLVSRAVVKGTVVVALIQSCLGAVAMMLFGIKTWILWGFVMFVLALIPLFGCWMVLVPASFIQIAAGNTFQGFGLLLVSLLVVSTIDNIIRPRLVGSAAKIHDLVIFFSILGGLATFGPLGFIVGPVIAAFFITLLEMYGIEFKAQLFPGNPPPDKKSDIQKI